MTTDEARNNSGNLNEMQQSINDAMRHTWKSKEGHTYTSVPVRRMRSWLFHLESATKDSELLDETKLLLAESKDQVIELLAASEAHTRKVKSLEADVATAQAAADKSRKANMALLNERDTALRAATAAKEAAAEAKVATAKALKEAEVALKQPAAKFDPDSASALQGELVGLRQDLALADDEIARAKSAERECNVEIDRLHKANAALDRSVKDAQKELTSHMSAVKGTSRDVYELFEADEINVDTLKLAFGERAFERLQEAILKGPFDPKGRIGRLQSFFSMIGNSIHKEYKAYMKLLQRTFDEFKSTSANWVAIIGPWVNSLLKDIVMMDIKSILYYRTDLEVRMQSVKLLPPTATLSEKVGESNKAGAGSASWEEVAAHRRAEAGRHIQNMKQALKDFGLAVKASAVAMKEKFVNWCKPHVATMRKQVRLFGWFLNYAKKVITWPLVACWQLARTAEEAPPADDKGKGILLFDAEAEQQEVS